MDLYLALRIEKSLSPTNSSTSEQSKLHEKWNHSNHMSLIIIKCGIPKVFNDTISDDITSAKEFLAEMLGNTLWECQILLQN